MLRSPAKLAAVLLTFLPLVQYGQTSESPDRRRAIGPLLERLDRYVERGMQKTGVPGVAVAVVYRDRVVYLKGFGVRKAGEWKPVNPNTVFQLASVSKPIASTIVASLVGAREVSWDDRITDLDPQFRLSDENVNQQLTIRDLLSHRSGLPTSAGDALEDLGFTRPEILHQMRLLRLPGKFRETYQYSNFGYTEGAIAAAKHVREEWETLAEERLFRPLGMTSTSYRYSDFERTANKAAIHVLVNGQPVARYKRDPDAEAPAGSASSSIRDMAEWLRLQLAGGTWNGQSIVDADALKETHSPQIVSGTSQLTGGPEYYGLGWNVNYDADGKVTLGHSGAFFLGTGTTVKFSPSAQLGIVVLTNARPTGLAEATANTFFDLYNYGKPTQDWLALFSKAFDELIEESNNESTDYSKLDPPSSPAPSRLLSSYVGTYRNNYYGEIEFTKQGNALWMRLPAAGAIYQLTHWDGDKFTYRFEAEQGIGTRGVVFSPGGRARVLVENLALEGDGNFVRIDSHP
jgi:CubicO group peptidase (beta-lactamase class C family)